MTVQQFGLFGGTYNLAAVEDKVRRILRDFPESRGLDKVLLVRLWMREDGLLEVLGDDALAERFETWFLQQASFPESVTRARRAIQDAGDYLPEGRHAARRDGRQQQFKERYGRN